MSPFDGVSGDQIKLDKSTGDRISSMWLSRYQLRAPAEAADWTTTDSAVPLKDFRFVFAPVSYTQLTLPTNRELESPLDTTLFKQNINKTHNKSYTTPHH